ncbi:MAG: DNA-binding protein [Cyclobacteriaceae bacterium]|nr:DNA-binding protein [Cyclobacteriaceae bacterium]
MKPIKQFLFWFITVLILVIAFGRPYGGYPISFYFVSFLLPVIIGTSYIFNSYLVPKYLLQKKYLKFALYTFYTIIISLNFEMLVIFLAFTVLANYEYDKMVPAATNIFGLAITMYFIVLIKAFMLLIKTSFGEQEKIQTLEEKQTNLQKGYLVVRADRKNVKILLEEILFVESLSDYVKIATSSGNPIITKEKISGLEQKLASPFIRIHRSFIINSDKVDSFSSETVAINGNELPISRTYKKEVLAVLKRG